MTTSRTFVIHGLDCANEVRIIRAALEVLPGVRRVDADPLRGRARIEFDEQETSALAIQQAIRQAGFTSEIEGEGAAAAQRDHRSKVRLIGIAGICILAGGLAAVTNATLPGIPFSNWVPRLLLLGGAALSARFYAPRAWNALRRRHADMNVLVMVATVGAFLLGEWLEGAAVSFLFAVANLLEAWSALRVRKSIERFLDLTPQIADRIDEATGEAETVLSSMVRKGDLLLVRPGGRIPVDGTVEQGCSYVNQSALTGEEVPLYAEPGTAVLAGSANGEAALRVRATEDARYSLAARVKDAVLRAQSQRSQTERWVERFSRRYTPMVVAAAILVALVPALLGMNAQEWFYNALVLVLIACPCALVISTPVTMVSAITALARGGVLLRGGESVERAASVKAVAFDKTGVLTTGQLRVLGTKVFPGADLLVALRAAAALERLSEHPVARAIVAEAERLGVPAATAVEYRALPGQGGEGIVDDAPVWVGSPRLAASRGAWNAELDDEMEASGLLAGTLVCVGSGPQLWLAIALGDQPRPGAATAIATLRQSGYSPLAMLTGDRRASAGRIAEAAGLTEVRASLLPEDKLSALRDLEGQGGSVAMVGDGLNDAPAMAAAHFSIASGDRGTNVTLEAADAVIWDGDLRRVPWLFGVCRQAMAIVRQNVVFAVGSKLAFAVLAALGVATLWMAVLADVGATILVTFNGLRMLRAAQAPAMDTNEALDPIKTSS